MRALCYAQLLAITVFLALTAGFTRDILAPTTIVASEELDCALFAASLPHIRKALRPRDVAADRAKLVLPVNNGIQGAPPQSSSQRFSHLPDLRTCQFGENLGVEVVESPETYSFTLNFTRIAYDPTSKSASFAFYWKAPNLQGKTYRVDLQVVEDFEWRVVSVDRTWVS